MWSRCRGECGEFERFSGERRDTRTVSIEKMAGSTGLEPATSGLTERDAREPAAFRKCRNYLASIADRVRRRYRDAVGSSRRKWGRFGGPRAR